MTAPAPWAPPPAPAAPKGQSHLRMALIGAATLLAVALAAVATVLVLKTRASPGPVEEPVAAAPTCYVRDSLDNRSYDGRADLDTPISCDQPHTVETIASGSLGSRRPIPGRRATTELFQRCEEAAAQYLGRPWRSTYTWLTLSVPSEAAFDAGDKSYRCDLAVNDEVFLSGASQITGSMRENAEPIRCLFWGPGDNLAIGESIPIDCDEPHRAESSGMFRLPDDVDPLLEPERLHFFASDTCWRAGTGYMSTNALDFPDEHGVGTYYFTDSDPSGLDRHVLCFIIAPEDKLLVGSLERVGLGYKVTLVDA